MKSDRMPEERLLAHIPRVRLFGEPSPLQRLQRAEKELGCAAMYVKRDDCIPVGMGGNKLRSLEFWLGQAEREECDILVVAGAPASNQCRLTAAAAAKLGLDCLILHSGDKPDPVTGNLLLNYLLGAEVRYLGKMSEKERAEAARSAAAELRRVGRRPYLIGDPVTGALGYVAGAFELYRQSLQGGANIENVFLPGSMGTTEAGFIAANVLLGGPFRVHLVSVEYSAEELGRRIAAILEGVMELMGADAAPELDSSAVIYEDYLGGGYDVPTEASLEAIAFAASREALFLENTYTSKTFAGMLDLLKSGKVARERPCCFLHTGGTPALFAQQAVLSSLFTDKYG